MSASGLDRGIAEQLRVELYVYDELLYLTSRAMHTVLCSAPHSAMAAAFFLQTF